MAVSTKIRFNLKYFFYWVLAVSFAVWGWTFLYLHSFNNVWGGKDWHVEASKQASINCYNELANLAAFHAPADELFAKRLELAGFYDQSREYKNARKVFEQQDLLDKSEPESQELLERQLKEAEFRAHTYLEEGDFAKPREYYSRAMAIAESIEKKYDANVGKLYKASLTNEFGIVDYMEGSCLISTSQRKGLFDNGRERFKDAVKQIDALNDTRKTNQKLDAQARQLSLDIKRHALANLALVEEDQRFEGMFEKS
jgi:tetratricopeptide (TPR) repeat protein